MIKWLQQYRVSLGGGTNLTELTSGEKAFIGLLFTPIAFADVTYADDVIIGATVSKEWSGGYVTNNTYHPSLDLSKITSVNIDYNPETDKILWWVDANNKNIVGIPSNNYNNVQVPSGAKGLRIQTRRPGHFQIISFTTTDGKVHTANNLNY